MEGSAPTQKPAQPASSKKYCGPPGYDWVRNKRNCPFTIILFLDKLRFDAIMRFSISPTMKLNDPGNDYEYKEREDNIMASKEKAARLEQRVHWEEKLNQRLSLMA
ncbi:MAG: hypothetical protein MUO68_09990, partial [Desulfobacteraceae bacterium]|nr:hypothetical protein [Desulfobacteraceae bacterium]